jgi:putative transposase
MASPSFGESAVARQPRLDFPGVPQHVVQRGNNRQPCFVAEEDYARYREDLHEAAAHCGCSIHAYVLMTNHAHLLVTGAATGAVSRMMQRLGRRYVAGFNASYRRTGTLWEGRFKSSLVDSRRYLLTCYRYIELNPVRAAMVADPAAYPWSSYRSNALGNEDGVISPHPVYLALGADAASRQAAYRTLFGAGARRRRAVGHPRPRAAAEGTGHFALPSRNRGAAGEKSRAQAAWTAAQDGAR